MQLTSSFIGTHGSRIWANTRAILFPTSKTSAIFDDGTSAIFTTKRVPSSRRNLMDFLQKVVPKLEVSKPFPSPSTLNYEAPAANKKHEAVSPTQEFCSCLWPLGRARGATAAEAKTESAPSGFLSPKHHNVWCLERKCFGFGPEANQRYGRGKTLCSHEWTACGRPARVLEGILRSCSPRQPPCTSHHSNQTFKSKDEGFSGGTAKHHAHKLTPRVAHIHIRTQPL